MSLNQRYAMIEYPSVNLSRESRERAYFLINSHYTNLYGKEIRYETVCSLRVKILELEAHMDPLRHTQPYTYRAMARQCTDFERICALLEILR